MLVPSSSLRPLSASALLATTQLGLVEDECLSASPSDDEMPKPAYELLCAEQNVIMLASNARLHLLSFTFKKDDPKRDFSLLIEDSAVTPTTLFIFNENYFGWRNPLLFANEGAGSACLRPYTYPAGYHSHGVFVAGIPTGWHEQTGGFSALQFQEIMSIDLAFHKIYHILRTHKCIDTVVFASDEAERDKIGQSIFNVHDDVINYISDKLKNDLMDYNTLGFMSTTRIDTMCRKHLDNYASMCYENKMVLDKFVYLQKIMKNGTLTRTELSRNIDGVVRFQHNLNRNRTLPMSEWK